MKIKIIIFFKFVIPALLGLGLISTYKLVPYRLSYNFSNSEAKGFYLLDVRKRNYYRMGDLVIVCIPDKNLANIALERGYLSKGQCSYGTAYEVKHIAALFPMMVEINQHTIAINNHKIRILYRDNKGIPLMSKLKIGVIPENYYFVLGKTNNSFDSRYYGLVPVEFIKGVAYPLFTWDSV
ncbi:MAG: conjugative transfer signal peptidase TraF [Burkholderiales bacterium]|nr:conjugative transfer signal peptidase TraF [Burkholderiales bacterium]